MEAYYTDSARQKGAGVCLSSYYKEQAGSGTRTYAGYRYMPHQRGGGFFGRIIKGSIMPVIKAVMPYLKDKAIEGVDGMITGLKEGKSFKEAGKQQLSQAASQVLTDMSRRVQRGSGVVKRRGRKRKALESEAGNNVKDVDGRDGSAQPPCSHDG